MLVQALMKEVTNIQVMGDSQLVIDWLKNKRPPKNIHLRPIYEEALLLAIAFKNISYKNIYRERNVESNKLSKQGLLTDIEL